MPRPFDPLNPLSSGSGTSAGPEGPQGPPGPPSNIPVFLQIFSGEKGTPETSPVRFGTTRLDLTPFPPQNPAGLNRQITFIVNMEVSNALATGTVRLRNVDEDELVADTTLTTTSLLNEEKRSIPLTVGAAAGNIKDDRTYEVAGFITGGDPGDSLTVTNAKLEIFYV